MPEKSAWERSQYAVKHTAVARATVIVVWFRKLYSLYFSLLNLVLFSMQRLSLRKIITNTHNVKYYNPSREKFLLDLNLLWFEIKSWTDNVLLGFVSLNFDHLKLIYLFKMQNYGISFEAAGFGSTIQYWGCYKNLVWII